jgi:hypothetical protein
MTGGVLVTTPGAPVFTSYRFYAPSMAMARIGFKPLNSPNAEPLDFFSPHRTTVYFILADGAVRGLATSTDVTVLQALATRAGGEPISGNY